MRFKSWLTTVSLAGLALSSAVAAPITILDNYIGNAPTSSSYANRDVIGDAEFFDALSLVVDRNGSSLNVKVYTRYLNNIGKYGTELGDVFLSLGGVDGLWEYALVMDNHLPGNTNGSAYLVDANTGTLKYSAASGIYRSNELYRINGADVLSTGSWNINKSGTSRDTDDYLEFSINSPIDFNGALGIRWTYSCGNDVLQGDLAAVPEPATLGLLGLGLLAIALVKRKK